MPAESAPMGHHWADVFARLFEARQRVREAPADTRARLERARTLIHAHYGEPLSLDALARSAAFSRYHFAREFRREFALPPHRYLLRQRMEMAKQLLGETDLSVIEICYAVGFQSLGSFTTTFTRYVGHPPGRFRATRVVCPGLPVPLVPACFLARFAAVPAVGAGFASFEKSAAVARG